VRGTEFVGKYNGASSLAPLANSRIIEDMDHDCIQGVRADDEHEIRSYAICAMAQFGI
jgi:hypothetical protein